MARKDLNRPATLILAWRRPELLKQLIASVRTAQPKHVFVACDAARDGCPEEAAKVAESRHVVETEIDWDCKLERYYSEKHQGCRLGVGQAISWFFENVDEGIILEDDCLPHPDFFNYCASLLELYRNSDKVWCISGNNFLGGKMHRDESYYFSRYPHCWGWATWRRAWVNFSGTIEFWPQWRNSKEWINSISNAGELKYWEAIFDACYNGKIDSWAYPWTATVWRAGAITAIPSVNLVQNIGFSEAATHTRDGKHTLSIATKPLPELRHPRGVVVDYEADAYVFRTIFCPAKRDQWDSSDLRLGALWRRVRRAVSTIKRKLLYSNC
jgi:hypothetical protein